MRYLVNSVEMRSMDHHSIDTIGIPSIVLMERAAESVVQEMRGRLKGRPSILIVCGSGNNGADGLAMARMLMMAGYPTEIWVVGDPSHGTAEWKTQRQICENLGLNVTVAPLTAEVIAERKPEVIVDSMLGTGLSRLVKGAYAEAIEAINSSGAYVVAVDIASGISSDTGVALGSAVQADLTVTFQCQKLGTALYPGRSLSGELVVRDIGIAPASRKQVAPRAFTMDAEDLAAMPKRPAYSNKGTFGRVLIVAGSKNMAGAAYLSATAAYRAGAGLVRIFTPEENREILQARVPEAIMTTYESGHLDLDVLKELCSWADAAVVGPGLGVTDDARTLVSYFLYNGEMPMVLDADALNIIAANQGLTEGFRPGLILTPHLGEMSRLTGKPIANMRIDLPDTARAYSRQYGVTMVLKDACTLVSDPEGERIYVNTCGNSGMATGGSGDVLTGVIAALAASGDFAPFDAAAYGVLMHGTAGDQAAADLGERAVMAGDIARRIS